MKQAILETFRVTEVPNAKFIREVHPDDWNEMQTKYMETLGWVPDEFGSYTYPEEQMPAYGAANYTCLVQYPWSLVYSAPWTEQNYRNSYEYVRDVILPCFAENDFPSNPLPSFEVYKATAGTMDEYQVGKFELSDDTEAIQAICGTYAPGSVVYGETR